MDVRDSHACLVPWESEEGAESLQLELGMVVSQHVGLRHFTAEPPLESLIFFELAHTHKSTCFFMAFSYMLVHFILICLSPMPHTLSNVSLPSPRQTALLI